MELVPAGSFQLVLYLELIARFTRIAVPAILIPNAVGVLQANNVWPEMQRDPQTALVLIGSTLLVSSL